MRSILFIFCFCVFITGDAQNVGIGTTTPESKLQINHRSSAGVPGLLLLDSNLSQSGLIRFRNFNSPKFIEVWGYSGNSFSTAEQYLDIQSDTAFIATFRGNGNVGINNVSPTERLDINGNINLTGVLKINGNAGNLGQVLTSSGTADPQWRNAAYSNNTRFYLLGTEGGTTSSQLNLTTRYNTNITDITVGSNSFSVNKTGLYHIEGSAKIVADWSPSASIKPFFEMYLRDNSNYTLLMFDEMRLQDDLVGAYERYLFSRNFSIEIYITAGSTITLHPSLLSYLTGMSFFNYEVYLRGHLINE